MKKRTLVYIIMGGAVLLSILTAFVARRSQLCTGGTNYYWNGSVYVTITGAYGSTWMCSGTSGTCSYYRVGLNSYAACRTGTYTPL